MKKKTVVRATAKKASAARRPRVRPGVAPERVLRELAAAATALRGLLDAWPKDASLSPMYAMTQMMLEEIWTANIDRRFPPLGAPFEIPPNFPHKKCWEQYFAATVGSKDKAVIKNALNTLVKCLRTVAPLSPA